MSSRIRLARNFENRTFPLIAKAEDLDDVLDFFQESYQDADFNDRGKLQFLRIADLSPIEKKVFVEKHLISPHLAEHAEEAGVLLSESEQVSIMVNEEDHLRIQLYLPGFQLRKALSEAFEVDDWLEQKITYAFDEERGYLTTCPTNVGTGLRASVMMHLPALTMTHQMNRLTPAINQLGLVVRGIYGEGSEAQGNIYQISNQITLGEIRTGYRRGSGECSESVGRARKAGSRDFNRGAEYPAGGYDFPFLWNIAVQPHY